MALTSGFYPSRDGDRKYSAEQFGALFDGIITDGIMGTYKDRQLYVEARGGRTLAIHPGRAWFNHTWVYNSTNYTINVDASEPLLDRIDAVVLKIDRSTSVRRASFYIQKGTPARNPVNPLIDTDTSTITYVALAYISVKAGASAITQGDIAWPAGGKASAFCTAPMQSMNVEQLQAQWKAQFNTWLNQQTTAMNDLRAYWGTDADPSNPKGKFAELFAVWFNFFQETYDDWQSTFSGLRDEWIARFRSIESEYRTRLENLYVEYRDKLLQYSNQFEAFLFDSNQTFDAFMERIDAAFDAFEAQKQQEIDDMLANLGSEFEHFWQEFKALMNDYLTGQETIWENWFTHIQGQLDEDAAGHLQNQIDALTYIYVMDRELVIPNNAGSVSGTELILGNPALSVQVPAFAVNPNSGHLEYESAANFNVDDTSGHIEWDVN